MNILENVDLTQFNTFRVHSTAEKLYQIESPNELEALFGQGLFQEPYIIIGGGANTLFSKSSYPNVLMYVADKREVINDTEDYVEFSIEAGADWNETVLWSVRNNYLGFQNLISIPGSVGATPIQNVGAYGAEIHMFVTKVEYFNLENGKFESRNNAECEFEYRYSIFKKRLKGKVFITKVYFKLDKYRGVIPEQYLKFKNVQERLAGKEINLESLANAIADIRSENLPHPNEYGSAGSVFENVIVSLEKYTELERKFPDLPKFSLEGTDDVKIPVGYILDKLGWKNKRVGRSGTWTKHALIVVNYGEASADEIINVLNEMKKDFLDATGIELDLEVNII